MVQLISEKDYQQITKDIAGSRTKNRFIYEMSYGISKLYELYFSKSDYFVIFDYACDIEIGHDNKIDFYQLKTTVNNYSIPSLLKTTKKSPKSILQTLVDLKCNNSVDKLFIVSNVYCTGNNIKGVSLKSIDEFCFKDLESDSITLIENDIIWPNGKSEIDSLYYLVSELCVKNPQLTLLGCTTKFLDKLYPGQPNKAQLFMDAITAKVREKASYEDETITLSKTIEKKGLTHDDITRLLKEYNENIVHSKIVGYEMIVHKIDLFGYSLGLSRNIKRDYFDYFSKGYIPDNIAEIINAIKDTYNKDEYYDLDEKSAVEKLVNEFEFEKFMSLFDSSKYLFAIYALCN